MHLWGSSVRTDGVLHGKAWDITQCPVHSRHKVIVESTIRSTNTHWAPAIRSSRYQECGSQWTKQSKASLPSHSLLYIIVKGTEQQTDEPNVWWEVLRREIEQGRGMGCTCKSTAVWGGGLQEKERLKQDLKRVKEGAMQVSGGLGPGRGQWWPCGGRRLVPLRDGQEDPGWTGDWGKGIDGVATTGLVNFSLFCPGTALATPWRYPGHPVFLSVPFLF